MTKTKFYVRYICENKVHREEVEINLDKDCDDDSSIKEKVIKATCDKYGANAHLYRWESKEQS